MNELQKYFSAGIDHLLDEAIVAIKGRLNDGLEMALFLAFVLECNYRRLKMLHLPEEMSSEEKAVLALSVENVSAMTDAEITAAFGQLDALVRAKFIIAMRRADGPSGKRFESIIAKMGDSEAVAREQNTAAIARRAQEEADKAREVAKEAEAKRVRTDAEALSYIAKAPDGRFQTVADINFIIKGGENGDEIFDWVNRRQIPVGDAMVVGKCLITDKATAERLAEKLRRPQDKNRPLAFSIAHTREFLAQCERENEAAAARKAEEAREAKASGEAKRDSFTGMVRNAFVLAITLPDKELVRNQLKAEAGEESWKRDIIRREAEAREQEIFVDFRQQLRELFPHSSTFSEFDAYIKEMEAGFIGRASDEGWSDNVIKAATRHVGIARRHRQWLVDNPRGVVQPAEVINFDSWESSSGRRERPKFGPGSGIGGQKREKTPEERLIHRGRQLAFGDRNYWTKKFNKAVEKFTDEDFKKVVELFGDVKGDRKAAKKQGGGKKS